MSVPPIWIEPQISRVVAVSDPYTGGRIRRSEAAVRDGSSQSRRRNAVRRRSGQARALGAYPPAASVGSRLGVRWKDND
jgi:hypothetical protein